MHTLQPLGVVLSNNPPPVPPITPTGQSDRVDRHVKNISGGGR